MKHSIKIHLLKKINYFFCGVIILLLFFLFLNLKKNFSMEIATSQEVDLKKEEIKTIPFSKYKSILSQRKLFKKSEGSLEKSLSGTPLNLVLLGIISASDNPQAMLKNSETGNTHNCYEGDSVSGFKIKEIQKNKVILESGERILELKL